MAKWSKRLKKDQLNWTNACFKKALLEVYDKSLSDDEKRLSLHDLQKLIHLDWRETTYDPMVNEIYLRNLRQLNTHKIELIIEAYQKGIQNRSALTIDVLMSELLERTAFSETRETRD